MESSINLAEELVSACSKRDVVKVEQLLKEGASPSQLVSYDSDVTSALHLVCGKLGDLHLLKVLHTSRTCNVDIKDINGCTPLHSACFHSHLNLVTYLIDTLKCDPNMRDNDGKTSLHIACSFLSSEQEHLSLKIVQFLIDEAGYDCNAVTSKGESSLMLLCRNSLSKTITEYLVHTCHCDISLKDNDDNTALHLACMCASLEQTELKVSDPIEERKLQVVKTITVAGDHCGMHSFNNQNDCPLEVAITNDFEVIASFLIGEMNKNHDSEYSVLPFHLACTKGNMKLIQILKKLKCAPSLPDKVGDTPLHIVCRKGHLHILRKLLKMECDMLVQNLKGELPIQLAIQHNHLPIVYKLWDWANGRESLQLIKAMDGFPLQSLNIPADLLRFACGSIPGYSDFEAVKVLKEFYILHKPQFIDHRDQLNGFTPLHYACHSGLFDIMVYLISEYKADINIRTNYGNSLLHLIAISNDFILYQKSPSTDSVQKTALEMVKFLIKHGCDPNVVSQYEESTPLMCLANNCDKSKHSIARYFIFDCKCDLTIQNKKGNTALHIASQTGNDLVVQMIIDSDNSKALLMKKNNEGNTALHLACREGNLNIINYFAKYATNCGQYELNFNRSIPLELAITNNHYEVALALLQIMDIKRGRLGNTMLHEACMNEDIRLVQCLARSSYLNMQDMHGNTPLHISCKMGNINLCEVLLEACCDVNIKNNNGDTPLHMAFYSGNFEIIKLLISDPQIKPALINTTGDNLLHIACKNELCTSDMVNYVLAVVKSDPNTTNSEGLKPIQLTTDAKKIHELIRYGANPSDVYSTTSVKVRTKNPPQPLVKIFVVGNPSVGKSTLIAALQKELSRIVKILSPVKKVSGVKEKTAGIIPCEFESKKYGQVALYDFAGQTEYYSTHAALLQNSIESSPPIFLIVVNLCDSYEEIKKTILYWLSFLENQCTSVNKELRPHIIVVGSHADVLESRGERIKDKACVIDHIKGLSHFKSLEVTDFISMDCQFSQSAGMKRLRKQLQDSCEKLRIKEEIRFNTHCFLVYLLDKFRDTTAVTLAKLFTQVCSERKVVNESNPLFFLPDCLSSLFELCFELNDRGHILFLKDKQTLTNSWVVLDKQSLLNEVLGTIFAPEGLKQYCTLSSNTGVVPTSKLAEKFSNYDSNMIVGFLTHLEFCHEVSDKEVLQLINDKSQMDTTGLNAGLKTYLFFPALIKLEAPGGIWKEKPQFVNYVGWKLKCSRPEQFFTSRFLEVLLLRLAFSCALATDHDISTESDGPSLKRKCTLWKNGIFWGDRYGIETLVEIQSDGRAVIVLMRSVQENLKAFLQLRSSIIQKILTTVSDFCAKVNTLEYFIDPSEVKSYPLNSQTLYNAKDVFNAIVLRSTCVVSENGKSLPVETLLTFEPYSYLGHKILSKIFSGDTSQHKKQIPEDVSIHLLDHFAQKSDVMSKILCHDDRADSTSSGSNDLAYSLKLWQENCDGTYHCLRQIFDQYSICAGRNLLEMAKLPPLPPSEIKDGTDDDTIQDGDQDVQCNRTHYAVLLQQLTDYATKWRLIGIYLGFRDGELDNIQGAPLLLQQAPVSWLSKMLSQWLEWAPEDSRGSTSYARLNALKVALRKSGIHIKLLIS